MSSSFVDAKEQKKQEPFQGQSENIAIEIDLMTLLSPYYNPFNVDRSSRDAFVEGLQVKGQGLLSLTIDAKINNGTDNSSVNSSVGSYEDYLVNTSECNPFSPLFPNPTSSQSHRFREIVDAINQYVKPFVENDDIDSISIKYSIPEDEDEEIKKGLDQVLLKGYVSVEVYKEPCSFDNTCLNNDKIKKKDVSFETTEYYYAEKVQESIDETKSNSIKEMLPNVSDQTIDTLDYVNEVKDRVSDVAEDSIWRTKVKGTSAENYRLGSNSKLYPKFNGNQYVKISGKAKNVQKLLKTVGDIDKIGPLKRTPIGLLSVPGIYQDLKSTENYEGVGKVLGREGGGIVGGYLGVSGGAMIGAGIVAAASLTGVGAVIVVGACVIGGSMALSKGGENAGGYIGGKVGKQFDRK